MTVRLVLVSLVACLGLTLPSAERLAGWSRGSQSGLVGWENGEPIDDGRFVFVADALEVPAVHEATVANTPEPASAVQSPDEAFKLLPWTNGRPACSPWNP